MHAQQHTLRPSPCVTMYMCASWGGIAGTSSACSTPPAEPRVLGPGAAEAGPSQPFRPQPHSGGLAAGLACAGPQVCVCACTCV
eukprot:1138326-Pelagomonas_calceolata.AAC.1